MEINRREFIRRTGASLGAVAGVRPALARGSRPNVLLVLVDQMRQPRWFPPDARLPHLERLKARGIEFTNHFVSAVPCSPSRACLMTGLHMDRNGVRDNIYRGVQSSLDPKIPTLGHLFRDAGYQTPYFGKWHLTSNQDYQAWAGLEPYGFEWKHLSGKSLLFPGLEKDGSFTTSACQWLADGSNHKKPWFLTLSLINPHDICAYPALDVPPWFVPDVIDRLPDNWDDDLLGKPRCQAQYQAAYARNAGRMDLEDEKVWRHYLDYYFYLTGKMDSQLGRLLDALDAAGQADNTMVIFTSDHGDMGGSHRLRAKGPFVYQENTNVPLVVSWPGRIPAGTKTDSLSQNVDLFPTLAAITGRDAGSRFPGLPGRDLTPILFSEEHGAADHVLFSFTSNVHVEMRVKKMGKPGIESPHNIRAIREPRWVYARYFDPAGGPEEYELYDMMNDPLEMRNLAGDPGYRAMEKEMSAKLKEAQENEMSPL